VAYQHYDRLTALDSSFLDLESPGVHMHVGSVGIFDPGPLLGPEKQLDFDALTKAVWAGLRRAPRFRQRLATTPLTGHPVWVDDEHFNLVYHVRHTALPLPGDERRLKRLVGRLMSQKLDRAKPLWELWFVEGLEGGRMAVISKVHHCLIDGISGVDLLGAFMGRDPEYRLESSEPPERWLPRPGPGGARLLVDDVWRRATAPARGASLLRRALGEPRESLESAGHAASGFLGALSRTARPASETPFNVPIGPHRRFDWTHCEFGALRELRARFGGTLNDVVLACVAGAARQFLSDRGVRVSDLDFRAFVPVSTRSAEQRGQLGNRVSMLVAALPLDEADPRKRLERIVAETERIKASGQVEGSAALEEISDWTSAALLTAMARLAGSRRAYNLVVTNVPGPQFPVYLNGARMLESYPLVPLFENNALGIALFSYDDRIFWGFNSDWEALPDVHDFVCGIDREFERLREA